MNDAETKGFDKGKKEGEIKQKKHRCGNFE